MRSRKIDFYGAKLKDAVQTGKVPMSEIDDHARRVLRAEFASGMVDHPVQKSVVDVEGGFDTARRIAEQSTVLLKNDTRAAARSDEGAFHRGHRAACRHGHDLRRRLRAGGSAGAAPPSWQTHVWFPTSPLKAMRPKRRARRCVRFWQRIPLSRGAGEGVGRRDRLRVPMGERGHGSAESVVAGQQDALIEQVAAANPRTIVVLETGTAVTMPWLDQA